MLININRNLNEFVLISFNRISNESLSSFSIFTKISLMQGSTSYKKWYNYLQLLKGNIYSLSSLKLNTTYTDSTKTSSNELKLIELQEDGKVLIDLYKLDDFIKSICSLYKDSLSLIGLENIGLYFYGISNIFCYKAIVSAYDKGNNLNLDSFSSDQSKLEAIKYMQTRRLIFTSVSAMIVICGLHGLIAFHKLNSSNTATLTVSSSSSLSPQNAFLFLLTKFKNVNIFLKLFVIFFIIPIFIYFSIPYIVYIKTYLIFMNKHYTLIKILLCLVNVIIIIYYLKNMRI